MKEDTENNIHVMTPGDCPLLDVVLMPAERSIAQFLGGTKHANSWFVDRVRDRQEECDIVDWHNDELTKY